MFQYTGKKLKEDLKYYPYVVVVRDISIYSTPIYFKDANEAHRI